MTLNEWAEARGFTDRLIAEQMTEYLRRDDPQADEVSVPAVQKYRTGRVPKADRMAAINVITEGWVTANDFYILPMVTA